GDAVAEQAADAVGTFVDDHLVAGPGELLGRGEAGRSGADDGDLLAGEAAGTHGADPAVRPGVVDDRVLDLLDRHRVLVDAEDAGGLARRRAQASGEVGEVVGGVETFDRLLPAVP